jgi:hypothetical protein
MILNAIAEELKGRSKDYFAAWTLGSMGGILGCGRSYRRYLIARRAHSKTGSFGVKPTIKRADL